jgi:predicted O-methyltransferase YrrM
MRRLADTLVALLLPSGARVAAYLWSVDGYLYPHEGAFLHRLAMSAPGHGRVVEIGSFLGRSTLCLASGVRRRGEGQVLAIDPQKYGAGESLAANLRRFGLDRFVEVCAETSVAVARRFAERARIVFVDGDHSDDAVRADVAAWTPHLEPGGFLVLHDSTPLSGFPGPRLLASALRRTAGGNGTFEAAGTIGSISWFRIRGGEPFTTPEPGRRWLDPLLKRVKRSDEPGG